ncbi:MAG: hypothetical protein IIB95_05255, partial [Candidatus Marinimicrobia bacterium]|nr:hypothetical protein [Candidatus Neomarinimicrobiota bacterium]
WRIVIFDIPEKRKKARDAINLKLKELGFHPIQKSTFIFPYECRNEIDFVAEHFFVRKYINYIVDGVTITGNGITALQEYKKNREKLFIQLSIAIFTGVIALTGLVMLLK